MKNLLNTIFLAFIAFWVALLPVYLWGYGVTIFIGNEWNRKRFWVGAFVGFISVILVYFLSKFSEKSFWTSIVLLTGFYILMYIVVFALTFFGSSFARAFMRKTAIIHSILIFCFTVGIIFITKMIPGSAEIGVLAMSLLLASSFEEGAKHLMSIGLTGKDFRFSKQDLIFFTFFVVLGFVFVENILYFLSGDLTLGKWVFRSFFTLIVHVFAASICAYFWWKALSYQLFSIKYLLTFLFGFFLASSIHMLYNLSLEKGSVVIVLLFAIGGYITFTRLIEDESGSNIVSR